ncbi:hypothetical protein B0A50_03410 [Salinomyces thailandicus]|uniref:Myb-like domain-containing protein n=1 Tax=Salinomyces thailandicus TaxID=706561 RepID=A0A4U0U293_9PEZI|nr:hypothetical protein B0A50_03410 [Salinomyces thailandica]
MSPWNDTTDRKLLLTIIKLTSPQLPKWEQVADLMGEGFTAESTRQHYQKLRKQSVGEPGCTTPGTATKGTPRKKNSKASDQTPSKSGASKRKNKGAEPEPEDADDDESPTKKMKAEPSEDDWLV